MTLCLPPNIVVNELRKLSEKLNLMSLGGSRSEPKPWTVPLSLNLHTNSTTYGLYTRFPADDRAELDLTRTNEAAACSLDIIVLLSLGSTNPGIRCCGYHILNGRTRVRRVRRGSALACWLDMDGNRWASAVAPAAPSSGAGDSAKSMKCRSLSSSVEGGLFLAPPCIGLGLVTELAVHLCVRYESRAKTGITTAAGVLSKTAPPGKAVARASPPFLLRTPRRTDGTDDRRILAAVLEADVPLGFVSSTAPNGNGATHLLVLMHEVRYRPSFCYHRSSWKCEDGGVTDEKNDEGESGGTTGNSGVEDEKDNKVDNRVRTATAGVGRNVDDNGGTENQMLILREIIESVEMKKERKGRREERDGGGMADMGRAPIVPASSWATLKGRRVKAKIPITIVNSAGEGAIEQSREREGGEEGNRHGQPWSNVGRHDQKRAVQKQQAGREGRKAARRRRVASSTQEAGSEGGGGVVFNREPSS
ncbi:hypothetical protein GALMADRAFT_217527 [Galerina marginata CBS 339.88]|uniref:Uncharacterized protein n=1 Tax=Galerina marginata (strain CBS 339.88) TaxID=685588 RepID=A0A067S6I3_GALM3|nr:hypothetical protein GALMADRAFT_217527 [Galerina marginata CBS 339.88]